MKLNSPLYIAGIIANIVFISLIAFYFMATPQTQESIVSAMNNNIGIAVYGVFMTIYNILIIPFPNDPFIAIAADIYGHIPHKIFALTVFACVASAAIDYVLGSHLGKKLHPLFENHARYNKAKRLIKKYGAVSIALTAITPLPYSLMSWLCGMAHTSFVPYILSAFASRVVRCGVVYYAALKVLS